MPNRVRFLAVITALLLLAGCGAFPTSGPVERIGEVSSNGNDYPVDISPASPVIGGDPETILTGFLAASMSTSKRSIEIAREYLAPLAAQQWEPNKGTIIFDGEAHPPITTQTSAILQSPVVGKLSAEGHYSSGAGEQIYHNFGMTQVDGEWRISNPGDKLFLSRATFERSFRAMPIHFLDLTGNRTVVENVYYAAQDHSPTLAIAALLKGPSAWLRPAVMTVFPAEMKNSAMGVNVNQDGTADVSLSSQVETLSADQRVLLAAQILWTLSSFPEVRAVRILVDDQLFTIRGQDSSGVIRSYQFNGFRPSSTSTPRGLAVVNSMLVAMPQDLTRPAESLGGTFSTMGWGESIGQFTASPGGEEVVVLNVEGNRLYSGSLNAAVPASLILDGTEFTEPQFDDRGNLWVIDNQLNGVPLLIRRQGNVWSKSAIDELGGRKVLSFSISSDQTRLALIFGDQDDTEVGMLRVRGADQLVVDGLERIVLNTARGVLENSLALGWANDSRLFILGSTTDDEHRSVYLTDVNGAVGESVGPVADVEAISLAVWPRAEGISLMIRTSAGRALKYEDRFRWTQVAEGVSLVGWAP